MNTISTQLVKWNTLLRHKSIKHLKIDTFNKPVSDLRV